MSPQRISCSVFSTGWPSALVNAIGQQAVEAGAFVDFVEMRQRLAFVEHARAVAAGDRRPFGVVQRPFDQIAGRQQVLQPLLILDADRVRSRNRRRCAARRCTSCTAGESARRSDPLSGFGPVMNFMPRSSIQLRTARGFVVADLRRFVIEGRLAEPFLVHAGRIQQIDRA